MIKKLTVNHQKRNIFCRHPSNKQANISHLMSQLSFMLIPLNNYKVFQTWAYKGRLKFSLYKNDILRQENFTFVGKEMTFSILKVKKEPEKTKGS